MVDYAENSRQQSKPIPTRFFEVSRQQLHYSLCLNKAAYPLCYGQDFEASSTGIFLQQHLCNCSAIVLHWIITLPCCISAAKSQYSSLHCCSVRGGFHEKGSVWPSFLILSSWEIASSKPCRWCWTWQRSCKRMLSHLHIVTLYQVVSFSNGCFHFEQPQLWQPFG